MYFCVIEWVHTPAIGWAANAGKGWGGGGAGLAILLAAAAARCSWHRVVDVIWCASRSWACSFCWLRSGVAGGSLIIVRRCKKQTVYSDLHDQRQSSLLTKVQNPKSAQTGSKRVQNRDKRGPKRVESQEPTVKPLALPPNQCKISPKGNLPQDSAR